MARHEKAGPFANDGERRVVKALLDRLAPNAVVFSNLYLPTHNDTLEIDAVVLSPHGAVVIEIKDWRGRVRFSTSECTVNDLPRQDPRSLTSFKAKVLHSTLQPWDARTVPLVVMAGEAGQLVVEGSDSVPVKSLAEAVSAVSTGKVFEARRGVPLPDTALAQIRSTLVGSHDRRHARVLQSYRLGEPTSPGQDGELWGEEAARPGKRVRLKRTTIDALASAKERDEQTRAAQRAFEALRELESRRLHSLPLVYACFSDPDDDSTIWTAYEGVEGTPLFDAPLSPKEKLSALASVAETLAVCHASGVLHRAISPECLIVPSGSKTPYVLRFELARIEGAPTIADGKAGEEIRHKTRAAPELRRDPCRASAAADIYALGFTAIEILAGARARGPEEARKVLAVVRPKEIRPTLSSMIEEHASKRIAEMRTVAERFRKVSS